MIYDDLTIIELARLIKDNKLDAYLLNRYD